MMLQGKANTSTKKMTIQDRKRVVRKNDHLNGASSIKSRIREMGPICKTRKKYERDSPNHLDVDFERVFNIAGQEEPLLLSSQSLSPLYKVGDFKFMSPRDYSIDERVISLVSTWVDCRLFPDKRVHFHDGSRANPIKEASLTLEDILQDEAETWLVENNRCFSFTDVRVSYVDLDGEDCKWISDVGLDFENLETNFPSPSFGIKWGSDVDVISLEEMEFDEPLIWPFDGKLGWNSSWDFSSLSPRRGIRKSRMVLKKEGRKCHGKEWWKKRFVVSRSTTFKRSGSKHNILGLIGKKHKLGSNQYSSFEEDWYQDLKCFIPSPCYKKRGTDEDDMCLEFFSSWDKVDVDEPLVWPYGRGQPWSLKWEEFCTSPPKGLFGMEIHKDGMISEEPTSIRVRIHDQRAGLKKRCISVLGLSASKVVEFKHRCQKKAKGRRVRGIKLEFGNGKFAKE